MSIKIPAEAVETYLYLSTDHLSLAALIDLELAYDSDGRRIPLNVFRYGEGEWAFFVSEDDEADVMNNTSLCDIIRCARQAGATLVVLTHAAPVIDGLKVYDEHWYEEA